MNRQQLVLAVLVCAIAAALSVGVASAGARTELKGVVFTETNSTAGNSVLVYDRVEGGALHAVGSVATGGLGTGAGLGSQGAVVLSDDANKLFVVNAASNEISAFAVKHDDQLTLTSKVASGGVNPISLTVKGRLLYVLNAGDGVTAGNITGFTIGKDGVLTPLASSTRSLSGASVGPAEIAFSPHGNVLVVTEKGTDSIDSYAVGKNGLSAGPYVQASEGATPFGFAFDKRGNLIVSDAYGGAVGASQLSSYALSEVGVLSTVTALAPDGQTAACWVVVTKNGRFAFTTNTGSANVSSYTVAKDGSISLLNGGAGTTGAAPTDEAISERNHLLYTLDSGAHAISAFKIAPDGSLSAVPGASALPSGTVGLAAS
jgi:6-phosphogluconolactonase